MRLSACAATDPVDARDTAQESYIDVTCVATVQPWEKWNRSLGFVPDTGNAIFSGPIITDAETVWAFGRDYHLLDGAPLEERNLSDLNADVIEDDLGQAYRIDADRRLLVFSPADGQQIHEFEAPVKTLPVFLDDGTGIVVTDTGLLAFDPGTFDSIWRYDTDRFLTLHTTGHGRIYLREAQWYTILDQQTGQLTGRSVSGAFGLTLTPDDTVVYGPTVNAVCKARADDLTAYWCVEATMDIDVMTTDASGNVYTVVTWPNEDIKTMFSLSFEDGAYRWIHMADASETESALLVNIDHTLIFKRRNAITAFNLDTGATVWTYTPDGNERIYSFTVGKSGDLYIIIKAPGVQTYRLVRLDHVPRDLRSGDLSCSPCQIDCVDDITLARCRPDGSGYMADTGCPAGMECRAGRCTACVRTGKKGCDGQDFVYLDSCGNGHQLIEYCGDLLCDAQSGCQVIAADTDVSDIHGPLTD